MPRAVEVVGRNLRPDHRVSRERIPANQQPRLQTAGMRLAAKSRATAREPGGREACASCRRRSFAATASDEQSEAIPRSSAPSVKPCDSGKNAAAGHWRRRAVAPDARLLRRQFRAVKVGSRPRPIRSGPQLRAVDNCSARTALLQNQRLWRAKPAITATKLAAATNKPGGSQTALLRARSSEAGARQGPARKEKERKLLDDRDSGDPFISPVVQPSSRGFRH